ncbi:MAG: PAS domain S-box protein [Proteobacteria bacterium]|nr:PAS domain S-box protein [Pseudomonadota bacterium]
MRDHGLQDPASTQGLLRDVLDSVANQIAVLDVAGNILAVNQSWRRFAEENGASALVDRFVGMSYLDVLDRSTRRGDDDARASAVGIRAVLAGERGEFQCEYPCHAPTTQRWFRMRVTPLTGTQRGAVVSHINLTVERQAQLALDDSEARFRAVVENGNDGILFCDADGTIQYRSPSYQRINGYADDERLGRSRFELIHPDDLARVRAHWAAARIVPSPHEIEYRFRHKDGTWRWSASTVVDLLDHPHVRAVVCANRDVTDRVHREAALVRSTALLDRVGALAQVGGAELDLRTGQVHWSAEMCRILDLDPALPPPPPERWSAFFEDDALTAYLAVVEEMNTRGTPIDYETPMVTATGRRIWVRIRSTAVIEDGQVVRLISAHQDITARKATEQALAESEARYRAVVELAPIAVVIHDAGQIRFSNPAAAQMLGAASPAALLDRNTKSLVHPDDWPIAQARLAFAHAHDQAVPTIETRYLRLDGSVVDVETLALPITLANKRVTMVVFRDISAQKQTDRERRLLSAALVSAANGIVITDRAGRIEWANPAFTVMSGYTFAEVRGHTHGALLRSGRHDRAFFEAMWATILDGRAWYGEMINRRKDGHEYTVEMTITPVVDEHGEITHFVAVTHDVTQRKQLEDQYRQAQKLESIGGLAGGIAHDFNNQLHVILSLVELELDELDPATPLHASLSEIRHAAMHSAALTRQLLTFARKQAIAPRVLDVNDEVVASLKMLQRMIGEHVQISWTPGAALWPILMDPSQLGQILTNLCINARDAIADVGRILLSTSNITLDAAGSAAHVDALPGDYVRLTVVDTGRGMTPEVLARIFEPFFTTKAIGEGTGLGLATVYGAIRQNHGFITVASTPEEGTTFEVYLPRGTRVHEAAALATSVAALPRDHETVLVVEDEPSLLRVTTRALVSLGYVVLGAGGPAEATRIALAHGGAIDLLLTDVVMPQMNGRDLAAQLTSARPGLKALFMSGYSGQLLGAVAMERLLAKPFSLGALATAVRAVLDGG